MGLSLRIRLNHLRSLDFASRLLQAVLSSAVVGCVFHGVCNAELCTGGNWEGGGGAGGQRAVVAIHFLFIFACLTICIINLCGWAQCTVLLWASIETMVSGVGGVLSLITGALEAGYAVGPARPLFPDRSYWTAAAVLCFLLALLFLADGAVRWGRCCLQRRIAAVGKEESEV